MTFRLPLDIKQKKFSDIFNQFGSSYARGVIAYYLKYIVLHNDASAYLAFPKTYHQPDLGYNNTKTIPHTHLHSECLQGQGVKMTNQISEKKIQNNFA